MIKLAYEATYQTYITDPNTLTSIQQANTQPDTGTINQDMPQEQKEITEEDVDQAQKDLVGQAFVNPAGAVLLLLLIILIQMRQVQLWHQIQGHFTYCSYYHR